MAITDFILQCRYRLGKLSDTVYLLSDKNSVAVDIDTNTARVAELLEQPIAIRCFNANIQDTSSLDTRFRFTHTLSFSVHGYANNNALQGRYYAIAKDADGNLWLLNAFLPCIPTYTYTLSDTQDLTTFTLSTVSNYPTLPIDGTAFDDAAPLCLGYGPSPLDKILLNERQYSTISPQGDVSFSNDGFKTVEPMKGTAMFTETFQQSGVTQSLSFSIPMDSYKKDWHYLLTEFNDNRYCAVLTQKDGSSTAVGFNLGLLPSFALSGSSTEASDTIQVDMSESFNSGYLANAETSEDISGIVTTSWVYLQGEQYKECVGNGLAQWLVQQQVDGLGNPLGNYRVREGYEDDFPNLNIVGTFTDTNTFQDASCDGYECSFQTDMPQSITFDGVNCKSYSITADSPWRITVNGQGFSVSPTSGEASTTVQVCNTSASSHNGSLSISYCGNMGMTVVLAYNQGQGTDGGGFTDGDDFTVPSSGGWVEIPYSGCIKSVTSDTIPQGSITVTDNAIRIYVGSNPTEAEITHSITVVWCDGSSDTATIVQGKAYFKWVEYGYVCEGNDKWSTEVEVSGWTESSCDVLTGQSRKKELVMKNSPDCLAYDPLYRWVASEDTYCYNGYLYYVEYREVSYDNGASWQRNGESRLGEGLGETCNDGIDWEYRWVLTDMTICGENDKEGDEEMPNAQYRWYPYGDQYVCSGGDKYALEYRQVSYDGKIWINTSPIETRTGDIIEEDSYDCGYRARWTQSGTVCDGYDLYQRLVLEESVDSGGSWSATSEYTKGLLVAANYSGCGYASVDEYRWFTESTGNTICDGYDLYRRQKLQVSHDGGSSWVDVDPPQYRPAPGFIVQENSSECGYQADYQYRWVDDSPNTICQGYNLCKRLKRQRSLDGESWEDVSPSQYSAGTIVQENSTECGYEPPLSNVLYSAVYTDGTTGQLPCDGTTTTLNALAGSIYSLYVGSCCEAIDDSALYGKSFLEDVELDGDVSVIGSQAFAQCPNLKSFRITQYRIPSLRTDPFLGSDNVVFYVPSAMYSNYIRNADWMKYSDRIISV